MAAPVLAAENPLIAIDDNLDDEAIGSDVASDTTSLKSYVLKFEYEYGRRYQNPDQGKYFFPNDEEEQDRMDLEHALWRHLLEQKLYLAPVNEPQKILDLGTGTGIWAIEVADETPTAQVIGTDLSPVQPHFVPPNAQFQVDNFENDWTCDDNTFDLIHSRLLCGSVTNYDKLATQALAALKPGGYFEMHDIDPKTYCDDGSMPEDAAFTKFGILAADCVAKAGRPVPDVEEYAKIFERAGFVNVKAIHLKRPNNTWPKDPKMKRIGLYKLCHMMAGVYAFSVYLFVNILGWKEEVEVFCEKVRDDLRNTRYHSYQRCVVVYGQKPEI